MRIEPNPKPTALEVALLDSLLDDDNPLLAVLRQQREMASIVSRERTGAGFFLQFTVPPGPLDASPSFFHIGDVYFELEGLTHGGGAILFIREGALDHLDVYSNDGTWPDHEGAFRVLYYGGSRDLSTLIQS